MGVEPTHSEQEQEPAQAGTTSRSPRSRMLVGMGVLAAAVVVSLVWYATSSNADSHDSYKAVAPRVSAPTRQPTPTVPSSAWLWCLDCGKEGIPVNVWEMAGTNRGRVVTNAPHGTKVTPARKTQGDDGRAWYKVSVNGHSGYVLFSFVTFRDPNPPAEPKSESATSLGVATADTATSVPSPTPAVMAQVTVDSLNVRYGPGTNYEVFTTINANERYTILALSPQKLWTKLDVAGIEGWAYTEYLSLEHGVVPVDGSLAEHEVPTSTPIPTATTIPTAIATATPTFTPWPTVQQSSPPAQSRSCCKICQKGKACGDSCISRSYTCHKGPGCACNG